MNEDIRDKEVRLISETGEQLGIMSSREALQLEVQRSAKRRQGRERRERQRKELNPAAALQPQDRTNRYTDIHSAMAEEGVIRLLLLDASLADACSTLKAEEFSSPLLGKIYGALLECCKENRPLQVSSLAGLLESSEMNHLTTILQRPESIANGPQAMADYIAVIQTSFRKRQGLDQDPLLAARDKFKNKKGYGGKQNA